MEFLWLLIWEVSFPAQLIFYEKPPHFCEITIKENILVKQMLFENVLDMGTDLLYSLSRYYQQAHIDVIYHHDIISICAFGEHLWILSIILRKKVCLMVDMVVTGLDIFLTR